MCDLDDPESFTYSDTWRADPEIAHLSAEWLKRTFDYMSPERKAKFELTKQDMIGPRAELVFFDEGHDVSSDAFEDFSIDGDDTEPAGLEESRPHL